MNFKKLNEKLNEFLQSGNVHEMSLDLVKSFEDGSGTYELDGVQFFKGPDEELANAVEVCIDEDFLNRWMEETDEDITSYTLDELNFDEETGTGKVVITLY